MFRSLGQSVRVAANRDLSNDARLQLIARLWINLSEQQRSVIRRETVTCDHDQANMPDNYRQTIDGHVCHQLDSGE